MTALMLKVYKRQMSPTATDVKGGVPPEWGGVGCTGWVKAPGGL